MQRQHIYGTHKNVRLVFFDHACVCYFLPFGQDDKDLLIQKQGLLSDSGMVAIKLENGSTFNEIYRQNIYGVHKIVRLILLDRICVVYFLNGELCGQLSIFKSRRICKI